MQCTVRCVSPPLAGAGYSFDVVVVANRIPVTWLGARWVYDDPMILRVTPEEALPPAPLHNTTMVVVGANFGVLPGRVTLGPRTLTCPLWTDDRIQCDAPPGAAPTAPLMIIAASSRASRSVTSVPIVSYAAPILSAVTMAPTTVGNVLLSGTRGGGVLLVVGSNFAAPLLPITVWLVRGGAVPRPPWATSQTPSGASNLLRCPLANSSDTGYGSGNGTGSTSATSTSLSCVVPEGSGSDWQVVVVNHDVQMEVAGPTSSALSLLRWCVSQPAALHLSYRAPTISAVQVSAATSGAGGNNGSAALAAGGFLLAIHGTDFSSVEPTVMVGALPCTVLPGTFGHETLTCTAPPRQVDQSSAIVVTVGGQSSWGYPFAYASPVLLAVVPLELDAPAGSQRPGITVRGINFGVRYRGDVPSNHTITVGGFPCGALVWISDAAITCVLDASVGLMVGAHEVTVMVAGSPSLPHSMYIRAVCPQATFGRDGDECAPCPAGAVCRGHGADPVALPGFYPLALAQFVPCTPTSACAGGVSASALHTLSSSSNGCSKHYGGLRCAVCSEGAYRLKGQCAGCPNTAWLLFLSFVLAVVAAVVAAMYLSKKRINMAGLSVGVVRAQPRRCTFWRPPSHAIAKQSMHTPSNVLVTRVGFSCVGLYASAEHVRGLRVSLATHHQGHLQSVLPNQLQL